MAVSKTRNELVDVARRLFAKNGFENTSMNEIAAEAKKGRRTLYTYFKSKEDIYYTVIQTELKRLFERLDEVANMDMQPEEKMVQLIFTHLESVKEIVNRNGNLRAEFFRNIWRVEQVRKSFDRMEIAVFRRVLNEGKDKGQFDINNAKFTADLVHYCLKGCETPYIYGHLSVNREELHVFVHRLVHRSIGYL